MKRSALVLLVLLSCGVVSSLFLAASASGAPQQRVQTITTTTTEKEEPVRYYTQRDISGFQVGRDQIVSLLTPLEVHEGGVIQVPSIWSVPTTVLRYVMSSLFSSNEKTADAVPPRIVVVDQAGFIIEDFPPINKGEPIGSHIMIAFHWPEDLLDVDMWIGYLIFVACLTFIPISVGLLLQFILCHVWAMRKCGCCGGSKPRKNGYSCTHRIVLRLVYIGFVGLIICCALIGLISNGLFATGSLGVIHSSFDAVDTAFQLFDDVISDLRLMTRNISNTFQISIEIIDGLDGILSPIQRLSSDMVSGTSEIDLVEDRLDYIDGNLTEAKSELQYLWQRQMELKCFGVPPPFVIPDAGSNPLTNAVRSQLGTARGALGSVTSSVSGMSSSVDATLQQAQNTSISFLQDMNTTVTSQVNKILDSIVYYKGLVEYQVIEFMYGFDRHDIHNLVTYAEYVRAAIVTCFFLFAIIIFGLGIFVIFTENKCGISFIAMITWFGIIVYFLLAGVGFGLFSMTNEFCTNKESIFQRYSQSNVYNLTNAILQCEGDTTLLGIVRNELAFFFPEVMSVNVTDLLGQYRGQYQSIRSQFQVVNYLQNITTRFDGFTNTTSSISTGLLSQNVTILNSMADNITTVDDPEDIPYSFDVNAYQSAITQINAITTAQVTPPLYFTLQNFSLFDPYEAPINESAPAVRSDLETRYTNTRTMLDEYSNVTLEISSIQGSASDFQSNCDVVDAETNALTSDLTGRLITWLPTQVSATMQDVVTLATGFDDNITRLYDQANFILDGILDMERFSQCRWIGETYRSLESNICDRVIVSISFMAVSCIATGLTMSVMFPLLLMLSKRVTRRFGNPFASLSENDEGPQNHELRTYRHDEYSEGSRSRSGSYSSTGSSYSSDDSR